MNEEHHPPLGVAVDRDVGRLPRYQLSPRLVDGRTLIFRDDFDPHGDWTPWAPAQSELDRLRAERDALREALTLYADPSFYHGCGFAFDRPTGGFDGDFDYCDEYGRPMPGKAARAALMSNAEVSGGGTPSA